MTGRPREHAALEIEPEQQLVRQRVEPESDVGSLVDELLGQAIPGRGITDGAGPAAEREGVLVVSHGNECIV